MGIQKEEQAWTTDKQLLVVSTIMSVYTTTTIITTIITTTVQRESLVEGKFGEFGESSVIHQTKIIQISTYNKQSIG